MKKSFKIRTGFNTYVPIEKSELPKAYYCFLNKSDMISLSGRPIRGKDIIDIEPNWNEVMGWSPDWKPDIIALQEIGTQRRQYAEALMVSAHRIARKAIQQKNLKLLEQPLVEEVGYYLEKENVNHKNNRNRYGTSSSKPRK